MDKVEEGQVRLAGNSPEDCFLQVGISFTKLGRKQLPE